jgi:hypothetical protein
MFLNHLYYELKPFIPRSLQLYLRRRVVQKKRLLHESVWPIDEGAAQIPDGWTGWPEEKRFALVLTHDVETTRGQERCCDLAKLEMDMGFRSSFNFVPERYDVSGELREFLTDNGFEVGVHDLNHDGKLYKTRKIFTERARKINQYLKEWNAVGFRSGSMHRNLIWLHDLNIEYDCSTFDTDPFEPQPEGVRTIFPFYVNGHEGRNGYVELPYTLPQDLTVFSIMRYTSIDIWKRKLDWIVEKGGMALLSAHPDYMNFDGIRLKPDEYAADHYEEFLRYVKERYEGAYWHVTPRRLAQFWARHDGFVRK